MLEVVYCTVYFFVMSVIEHFFTVRPIVCQQRFPLCMFPANNEYVGCG
jgi:hypothetical protein